MSDNVIAIAVNRSGDSKLGLDETGKGLMSGTYSAQQSCPDTCIYKPNALGGQMDGGCFGNFGNVAVTATRLNNAASAMVDPSPEYIAEREAEALRKLKGERPLRIHVEGDCKTDGAARILSGAAEEYMAKHGEQAFTYTHAWMDVARESWGMVNVQASCETAEDVSIARERGYATAMT